MLNSVIEVRGPALVEVPEIRADIQSYLMKFLLISMSTRNLGIFTSTLRMFFNFYLCGKQYPSNYSSVIHFDLNRYLKTHLEAFFTALLCRIVDNKNTTYEQQELALECLVEFCRLPYMMAGIFTVIYIAIFMTCTRYVHQL